LSLQSWRSSAKATGQTLARIAQEALNNLSLVSSGTELVLSISDDGRGFDPSVLRPGHFGLETMRERVRLVGVTLEPATAEGSGTHLRIRVPRVP
jgi:signal transduction histidine kinase